MKLAVVSTCSDISLASVSFSSFILASPPMVVTITEPKIKIVQVGESVTLQCNVDTKEQDVTITWVKEDGTPISPNANTDSNGILIMTNVQAQDSGVYVCKASNAYFVVSDKATLNVGNDDANRIPNTNRPPQINEIQPSRSIEVIAGENVQLFCDVVYDGGNGKVEVTWLQNGQILNYGQTLYLENVSEQNQGELMCRAENNDGFSELSAYIYVRSRKNYIFLHTL